jgi:hypothetical protein
MSYQIDIIFWESSVIEYPVSPSRTNGAHWCFWAIVAAKDVSKENVRVSDFYNKATRKDEHKKIIHRVVGDFVAGSTITVLCGQCKREDHLCAEMRHVPWSGFQRHRALGQ